MLNIEQVEAKLLQLSQEVLLKSAPDEILARLASALAEEGDFRQVSFALYDRPYPLECAERAQVTSQVTLERMQNHGPGALRGRKSRLSPLVLALQVADKALGQVALVPSEDAPGPSNHELRFYQALVNIGAIAIHQAQRRVKLEELSIRDDLTGCYNRRYFYDSLGREAAWAQRYGRFFSLLILDCDRLKAVNDQHGHLAGDAVLRALGALLRKNLRSSDLACRYGGDEFALILPETSKSQAGLVAQRLIKKFERHPLKVGKTRVRCSASWGVSTFPHDGQAPEALIEVADRDCYRRKALKRG